MDLHQMHPDLTRERVLELFTVDLVTGKLFWKARPRVQANLEAGFEHPTRHFGKRYWCVTVNGRRYKRSRIIFLVAHGRMPSPCADHINGNTLDDRAENIREATVTQNAWNRRNRTRLRSDLPMGVCQLSSGGYGARIGFNGRQTRLGTFSTVEEAHSIYLEKRKELFGEFA